MYSQYELINSYAQILTQEPRSLMDVITVLCQLAQCISSNTENTLSFLEADTVVCE